MYAKRVELAQQEIQVPFSKSGMRGPLENTFSYLKLPLHPGEGNGNGFPPKHTSDGLFLYNRVIPAALVPNVVDMGLKDALLSP